LSYYFYFYTYFYFNPRAREGRDSKLEVYLLYDDGFNPRAREGRDFAACLRYIYAGGFNPRAREGRDFNVPEDTNRVQLFQSTRPRRTRPVAVANDAGVSSFQSTRPRRTRPLPGTGIFVPSTFQSTRPRRTRHFTYCNFSTEVTFQSTRPRRTRLRVLIAGYPGIGSFNPRAREGRDLDDFLRWRIYDVSIHAPAKDATTTKTHKTLV